MGSKSTEESTRKPWQGYRGSSQAKLAKSSQALWGQNMGFPCNYVGII